MSGFLYLDFDLQIERSGDRYRAEANSPAGQASATFTLPFSDLELENFLLRIGRTRGRVRRIDSPEVKAAKVFGETLFESVFAGELRGILRSSIEEARRKGAGLRIRLRLTEAPELTDLPWEYLYNSVLNRFLCLSVDTPLVRFLDMPELVQPLTVAPPLNVLVMISSPPDFPKLDVEREWAKLREALGSLESRGLVSLERLAEPSLAALQRQLRRGTYHVFHFIGHGGFDPGTQDGVLVMEDDRRGRLVSGQDLGVMLHDHRSMRMVVLNACEGARTSRTDPFAGAAQSLVQQGLAAVIAMQFEISDEAAITFSHEFYGALADGYPVDAALIEARKAIFAQENGLEWGTPVLYLRAPDGRVFDVEQKPGAVSRRVDDGLDAAARRESAIPADTAVVLETVTTRPTTATPLLTPVREAHGDTVARTTDGAAGKATRDRTRRLALSSAAALLAVVGLAGGARLLGQGPAIERFVAEPDRIVLGESSALRWQVAGADAVEISPAIPRGADPGAFNARAGAVAVRPTDSGVHSYTLKARRGGRVREQTVSLTVRRRPPVIRAFTSSLDPGRAGRVTLRWDVGDATTVRLEPEPGSVAPTGSVAVDLPAPGRQVLYRLTAGNPDHEPVERVLAVTSAPRPPVISRFEIRPGEITAGQPAVLAWSAPGADTVSISGVGTVAASGSRSVSPRAAAQYVLTASNEHGTVTRVVTVRVRPAIAARPTPVRTPSSLRTPVRVVVTPRGVITPRGLVTTRITPRARPSAALSAQVQEFAAQPSAVNAGEPVRLCWIVLNAQTVRIEPDVGEIGPEEAAKGCRTLTPKQSGAYTLTVVGADGRSTTSRAAVEVRMPSASAELTVARSALGLGDSTELCWITFNARSVRIEPDVGDVPAAEVEKGCRTVAPRQTTTYTITVTGSDGKAARRQVTVEVRLLEVQIVSFTTRKPLLAPGESTQVCWVVANARSLRLDPDFGELTRGELERGCREVSPRNTTTYFLIAVGRDGKTITQTLLVAVRLR